MFLPVTCLLICMSCYNEKEYYIPDIKVYVFYETVDDPEIKKPDAGAWVYLFYGKGENDFDGFTYQGEGIFIKEDSPAIEPDLIHVTGENGTVFFIPEYTGENAVIVVESNYYKGDFDITPITSTMHSAGLYRVFKPAE